LADRAGPEGVVRESAPAKVNLILHVGPRRADGLHELCSLFASIELADVVIVAPARGDSVAPARGDSVAPARGDSVAQAGGDHGDSVSPVTGVEDPNLCHAALAELRDAVPDATLPPLKVTIDKTIPVAAGLGGGSADAAAVLRAANQLAGQPLDAARLRTIAARVGADVPSQVEPGHAVVTGAGERVEPVALPPLWLVLATQELGLSTAAVYAEADRIGATRKTLDVEAVRTAAQASEPGALAGALENDLQRAALSLRPELSETVATLERSGALAAVVTGSGPTVVGVFEDERAARAGARPGDIVTRIRNNSPTAPA
jgi:4-diphosphocytidyl-2-C-methyl-D-erythritol kinase